MAKITLVGLGPGDPGLLSRIAYTVLDSAANIYTPTPDHPALAEKPQAMIYILPPDIFPVEHAAYIQAQAATGQHIIIGLPGHPCDNPITMLLKDMPEVEIIPGISLLDTWCLAAGIDRSQSGLQYIPAEIIPQAMQEHRDVADPAWCEVQGIASYTTPLLPYPFNPCSPALIWGWSLKVEVIHQGLLLRYPPTHPLCLIRLNQYGQCEQIRTIPLCDLPQEKVQHLPTAIFVEPIQPINNRRVFDGLTWVVTRLLGPNGCPWDRQQTFQTLRPGILEETYEVLEALDTDDMALLREELGDLLLQVVILSEMARQEHSFHIEDVIEHVTVKLIRRHPHVFGQVDVRDSDDVLNNWEQIKAQELTEKGRGRKNTLDGIPSGLPALATAQKMISKASRAGFDWDRIDGVWAKFQEELEELFQANHAWEQDATPNNKTHLAEELGDVLFVTVNLARWLGLDAESILRETCAKFSRRFTHMERILQQQGQSLKDLTISEALALWHAAKSNLNEPHNP